MRVTSNPLIGRENKIKVTKNIPHIPPSESLPNEQVHPKSPLLTRDALGININHHTLNSGDPSLQKKPKDNKDPQRKTCKTLSSYTK